MYIYFLFIKMHVGLRVYAFSLSKAGKMARQKGVVLIDEEVAGIFFCPFLTVKYISVPVIC